MTLVPQTTYQVLHCEAKEIAIEDKPDIKAWVKRTTIDSKHPFAIWSNGDTTIELTRLYPDLPSDLMYGSRTNRSIAVGRAMINPSLDITTAGGKDLPRFLWRATHDGQPHLGLKSRSPYGAPGQFFAIQWVFHYNWRSRVPSPFMSWTSEESVAFKVAAIYRQRGFKNIKVNKVDTQGEGWIRERQRIWSVQDLARAFDFPNHPGLKAEYEYLIENSVPQESTTTDDWLEIKDNLGGIKQLEETVRADAEDRMKEEIRRLQSKQKALKEKMEKIKKKAKELAISEVDATRIIRTVERKFRRRYRGHSRLLTRRN
jgi:hypothetical protein